MGWGILMGIMGVMGEMRIMVKEGDVDAGCFLALNKANNQVLYH